MLLRLVFGVLLGTVTLPILAQADTTQLRARLTDYGRFTTQMKLDSLLDYLDPELFEIVDRPTMRATFTALAENPDMDIRFRNFRIGRIGALVTGEGATFAPVSTTCEMVMHMQSADYCEPLFLRSLVGNLRRQYGENRVTVDEERAIIRVRVNKNIFAVQRASDRSANWYFLEHNAANPELLELLVPEEVRRRMDVTLAH